MRSLQFFSFLSKYNIHPKHSSLISNTELLRKYKTGSYNPFLITYSYLKRIFHIVLNKNKVIWIEKELFPWVPAWFELMLIGRKKVILDFDDAIFHNYDMHPNFILRRLYSNKIDKLMARATVVTVGNSYLKNRAIAAGAKRIEMLPTVIHFERYKDASAVDKKKPIRIVWIGTPSTSIHLKIVSEALNSLSIEYEFSLRIIGAKIDSFKNVNIEYLDWSESTEVTSIAESDIGIMPLYDGPFQQGKCAYKLIQYMACGIPTISSPVGANNDVVIDGQTGLFARSTEQWVAAFISLLNDAELRRKLGSAGLERAKTRYTLERQSEKLAVLIKSLESN